MSQLDELSRLDALTASLSGHDRRGPCSLLVEHLRAARTALLGAMHGEYCFSLEQALGSVSCVPEKSARLEAKHMLQSLLGVRALKTVLPAAR